MATTLCGADWPQFRGFNSAGMAAAPLPPVTFGPGTNELWNIDLASGHSSPCVSGSTIYLTTYDSDSKTLAVVAINRADGSTRWHYHVDAEHIESGHPSFNPASSTPASDGECVVAYFGSSGLQCLDTDGQLLWHLPLPVARSYSGNAVSPILVNDQVILYRASYEDHFLLAVDRRTGRTTWKVLLDEPFTPDMACSATPVVFQNQIIVHGARAVQSFDVQDGRVLWSLPCSTTGTSTPVLSGEELIVASWNQTGEPSLTPNLAEFTQLLEDHDEDLDGLLSPGEFPRVMIFHRSEGTDAPQNGFPLRFQRVDSNKDRRIDAQEWEQQRSADRERREKFVPHGILAIRLDSRGELSKSDIRCLSRDGIPEVPSPLAHRGKIYYVKNGGILTCLDQASGRRVARLRTGGRGTHYASPVLAGHLLFTFAGDGRVTVLTLQDKLRVLGHNDLPDRISATPAIVDGTIYLRTHSALWAFGGPPGS